MPLVGSNGFTNVVNLWLRLSLALPLPFLLPSPLAIYFCNCDSRIIVLLMSLFVSTSICRQHRYIEDVLAWSLSCILFVALVVCRLVLALRCAVLCCIVSSCVVLSSSLLLPLHPCVRPTAWQRDGNTHPCLWWIRLLMPVLSFSLFVHPPVCLRSSARCAAWKKWVRFYFDGKGESYLKNEYKAETPFLSRWVGGFRVSVSVKGKGYGSGLGLGLGSGLGLGLGLVDVI